MQSTLILIQVPVGACQRTHTFHHPLNPSPTTKHAAQYRLSGAKVKEMLICCQAGSLCRGKLWRICAAWRKWGEGGRDWETERQEVNVLPGSTLITKQQRKDQQEAREESENANEMKVTGFLGWQDWTMSDPWCYHRLLYWRRRWSFAATWISSKIWSQKSDREHGWEESKWHRLTSVSQLVCSSDQKIWTEKTNIQMMKKSNQRPNI